MIAEVSGCGWGGWRVRCGIWYVRVGVKTVVVLRTSNHKWWEVMVVVIVGRWDRIAK